MALRIRGQEISAFLVVDGAIQQGSFTKIENLKVTPMADLSASPFLGETEDEPDVQYHGYDFSFTAHEMDNNAMVVWDNIVAQLTAGAPLSQVDLVIVKRYRDPSIKTVTMTLSRSVIKIDSQDFGGRKDFVKTSFSGKCRTKKTR